MYHHSTYNLWLHDDAELAMALRNPIARRTFIHEWPFSRVEHLLCADGQEYIYKVQGQPTVEPEFYQRARSPLLVGARTLPNTVEPAAPPALLLEFVRAPRLSDLQHSEARKRAIADELLDGLRQIDGTLPARFDLRDRQQWLVRAHAMLRDLRQLLVEATLPAGAAPLIDAVERHCHSRAVAAALAAPQGYVHGDLHSGNVLVCQQGYRVLDWQRPFFGPLDLDRAALWESLGLAATPGFAEEIRTLKSLLSISLSAEQALHWYPPGKAWFAKEILREAGPLSRKAAPG
jgi:aminoglycoside phosphotransferase (APT) family kinase protein